jgi:AraC-like DNA-binding protein
MTDLSPGLPAAALATDLLRRLRPLLAHPQDTPTGLCDRGLGVFSYCARENERIARVQLPHPVVGILVQGAKEVWFGDLGRKLAAGDVFVLPGAVGFDVVNLPDPDRGLYQSLLFEVASPPPFPPTAPPAAGSEIRVPLTAPLVDVLSHAALALAGVEDAGPLAALRMTEVLLFLRDRPEARPLWGVGLAERVAWLVRADPARGWTAAGIADRLAMAPATLRRRLAGEGTSLRRLLAAERMEVARDLLVGGASVTEAAAAAGYASRSHFARGFRAAHGALPRQTRKATR